MGKGNEEIREGVYKQAGGSKGERKENVTKRTEKGEKHNSKEKGTTGTA